jgi:hypothetical protein
MAKEAIPDATLTQLGFGSYRARFFNPLMKDPTTGEMGAWMEVDYIDGFAQAKLGMIQRRKQGKAIFKNLIVIRRDKGKY